MSEPMLEAHVVSNLVVAVLVAGIVAPFAAVRRSALTGADDFLYSGIGYISHGAECA